MKAILILAGPYSSCFATENIWKDVCNKNKIAFEMFDLFDDCGKKIVTKYNIKSFPALIVNDKVVAVGHPNEESANKVIQGLTRKT